LNQDGYRTWLQLQIVGNYWISISKIGYILSHYYWVKKESNCLIIDLERQRFEEGYVNVHQFFIVIVKVKGDQLIQEGMTENIDYKIIHCQKYYYLTFLGHLVNVL
jgi:hypothetical protein